MVILKKAIHKFSEILIKNSNDMIHRNIKKNPNMHMKTQMTPK
jgi:hypothetical protein